MRSSDKGGGSFVVKWGSNEQQEKRSRLAGMLGRGLAAVALAGLGLSGCSGSAPWSSAPPATPDSSATAAAPAPSEQPGQATPDGSAGASPGDGSAGPSSDDDNARPSGTPALPLPNPVTTPIAKAVRGDQPTQPSITAAADTSAFSDTVSYSDGVTLKITKARKAAEEGHGPGVFPGREYVAFDVEVTNGSGAAVDLSSVVVSAHYGDAKQLAPAVYTASAETADLHGTVQPGGGKATGTYAFAVPASELGNVTLVVDFDGAHASAVYSGRVELS